MDITKAVDPIRPIIRVVGYVSLAIALAKLFGVVVPMKAQTTELALIAIACLLF